MWPWEHAAVAYIGYSLLTRFTTHRSPGAAPVVALLIGSQVPDLVDKPLAWWLQILPSGRSLGHSLFFALPVSGFVLWGSQFRRRTAVGVAFVVGYLLHLPGDVVYPVLLGDSPAVTFLLYPLVPRAGAVEPSALGKVAALSGDFIAFLQTSRGMVYLGGELALFYGRALALGLGRKAGARCVQSPPQAGTDGLVRGFPSVTSGYSVSPGITKPVVPV